MNHHQLGHLTFNDTDCHIYSPIRTEQKNLALPEFSSPSIQRYRLPNIFTFERNRKIWPYRNFWEKRTISRIFWKIYQTFCSICFPSRTFRVFGWMFRISARNGLRNFWNHFPENLRLPSIPPPEFPEFLSSGKVKCVESVLGCLCCSKHSTIAWKLTGNWKGICFR